ncbi:hypothetical protein PVAP13_8KG283700 [Panicum virgatum]|uniref:Uncharacterized protein n=1 Tax=Panicum virgatum TaxID=38727 RepID=A0A8T0PP64_PANVG|nr:hypothetical protein PVAP13_8KG283700 [Panicum virgatum]
MESNSDTVSSQKGKKEMSASHDCGFHKLMHAQHWGRAFSVQHSRKEDICNIQIILMHTWLNFEENDSGKAS